MEKGSIPDSNITASSEQSANTPAKNGRLNFTSGSSWCARTSDANPYLQIDLQTLHIICAVSTQGNPQADQWVKNYTLQSSTDGSTWTDYTEIGQIKVTSYMYCVILFLFITKCVMYGHPINTAILLLWPLYSCPSSSSDSQILLKDLFNMATLLIRPDLLCLLVIRSTTFHLFITVCTVHNSYLVIALGL